ncbi:MarR family transcriptional regulator [Acidianus sp. HS-5]|uniref:MarR family transcriptional regulator n=1 Tax=Acidianus sp. HS-5 TaxID=2886040 RepID=UPI001F39518C|nr:MarR family transcriptional regulator [Acidianus sp. HS-5]BDC17916.1 hypothetical protein HS5_08060 [Acidianus sp. HS-5]
MKRDSILEHCKSPKSFSELKKLTGMSDAGLSKALNDLIKDGYLQKTSDGKYVITDKALNKYKEMWINGIWFKYSGIPDEKIKKIAEILKDEKEFYITASKESEELPEELIILLQIIQ